MRNIFLLALLGSLCVFAGCGPNHEASLRKRSHAYTTAILDDKFDDAVNYVDPDIVATKGRTQINSDLKTVVGIIKGLAQLGGRHAAGFEIRTVDISSDKKRATLQIVIFTTDANGGDRKEHPSDQKWVQKNQTWYIVF
jgi:hypothetical protein